MLTVLAPATVTRLTTAEAVRAELGLTALSHPDSALNPLIDQATGAISRYCRRVFARETVEETFRAPRGTLMLRRFPAVSITSVTPDNGVALSAADYDADLGAGMLRLANDRWRPSAWGYWTVGVVYVCGYLLPGQEGRDLPQDIERAAIREVASYLSLRDRDPLLRSESVDGVGSVSYAAGGAAADDVSFEAARLLRPHKRMAAA